MELRFKTGDSVKNISIINTYAPHMSYDKEEINKYWNKTQKLIKNIPNNLIKIWCTDNNGKIAQDETYNSIGKWTIAHGNEKGNGENYSKTIEGNNTRCTNTFFISLNEDRKNLTTWDNHDGAQNRQIDYIAIDNKNRNWVINISNKYHANPHFIMQHKILKTPIRIKLKQNQGKTTKDADIQYDIYKLRKEPKTFEETIDKILQNHTQRIDNWGKLTRKIKTL